MKKKIIYFGQIILTGMILYLIFRRIDLKSVLMLSINLHPVTFILLVITSAVKLITQYFNWICCLKINSGYNPPKFEVIRSLFIGNALRFLLPGGHGTYGKVYFLNHSKKGTLFSIGMEKFMLTWTILLFGSVAAFFHFVNYQILLRFSVIIVVATMPFIVYWGRYLFTKHAEYFNNYIRFVPRIFVSQLLFIFITVLQYVLIINQYQLLRITDALKSVPLILTANTIPITFSGLGLRESFAMYTLNEYGIQVEVAITASLLIFFINSVIPAFIGSYFIVSSKK